MSSSEQLEEALKLIQVLQEQLVTLEQSGREYELQLEQTVEELRHELDLVGERANSTITKLEIQMEELQEQNRRLESRYLTEREQNGMLIQDKLLLQCEVEQLREEIVRLKFGGPYDDTSESDEKESRTLEKAETICGKREEGVSTGPPPCSPLSMQRSLSAANLGSPSIARAQPRHLPWFGNMIGLPHPQPLHGQPSMYAAHPPDVQASCPSTSPPLQVMFKGSSLMLRSMVQDDSSMIVPSLSQATVMATTASQPSRR